MRDKVNVSLFLFEREGDSAHGCVTVEAGWYYVAAFMYANNTFYGLLYIPGIIYLDRAQGTVCTPALSNKSVIIILYSITEGFRNNIPIEGLTIYCGWIMYSGYYFYNIITAIVIPLASIFLVAVASAVTFIIVKVWCYCQRKPVQ